MKYISQIPGTFFFEFHMVFLIKLIYSEAPDHEE